MTKLRRSIRRETEAVFKKKPLVIQLEAPGIVRIKEKGSRTWFETSVEAIYCMAARQHAEKIRAARRGGRQ